MLLNASVAVDVLQRREPFFQDAADLMAAAESGRCRGLVAAHTVTTLFSLIAMHASPAAARVHITELLRVLEVAPVDRAVLQEALALPYAVLEDGVQMAAAEQAGVDYVVTRDRTLYAAGPLPVLAPAEMLALLGDA